MDKISGIIPSSARVTSVDMRESSPVRPGTPNFGRAEGSSSLKEAAMKAAQLSTGEKALGAHAEQADWRSKDAQHASLVTELSDKFFNRNQKVAEPMRESDPQMNMPALRASEMSVSSRPSGFKTDDAGSFRASMRPSASAFGADDELAETTTLRQPEGLYPKGSFIDRSA